MRGVFARVRTRCVVLHPSASFSRAHPGSLIALVQGLLVTFLRCGIRNAVQPMLECAVTGLLAWRGGQPGQVGNEAATAVFRQCRGSGSSPSFSLPRFFFSPLVVSSECVVLPNVAECAAFARCAHANRLRRSGAQEPARMISWQCFGLGSACPSGRRETRFESIWTHGRC